MILFSITKGLFDEWIKQLIAASLLGVMVLITLGLMLSLILEQMQAFLYFEVCWNAVTSAPWSVSLLGIKLWEMIFWVPADNEVGNAVTAGHFFAFLIVSILFNAIIGEIPELVDSLSSASRQPLQSMYGAAMGQYNELRNSKILQGLQVINPVGAALQAGSANAPSLVKRGVGTVKTVGDNIDKGGAKLRTGGANLRTLGAGLRGGSAPLKAAGVLVEGVGLGIQGVGLGVQLAGKTTAVVGKGLNTVADKLPTAAAGVAKRAWNKGSKLPETIDKTLKPRD